MHDGRLIRVSKGQDDPKAVSYIVAVADSVAAIDMIRSKVARDGDRIEDLGHVSGDLLRSLEIRPGDFIRTDAAKTHYHPAIDED
jgi:hypothetical protein